MKPYIYTYTFLLLLLAACFMRPAVAVAQPHSTTTIAEALAGNKPLTDVLQKAGLMPLLSSKGSYTFFVPSGVALQELSQMEATDVREVLMGHLLEGRYTAADLKDGAVLTTMNKQTLKVCRKKNKLMLNGRLVTTQQSGLNKIYHWKHNYPITSYLIAIAVTNYAEFTLVAPLSQGPLDIVNYVYPQSLTTAQAQVPGIIPIIQLYDTLFAPYPFMGEKYGHAQFGWGGGMEHQTMSFMTDFSRDLMAHELAHQWFGNMITCGSWHDMWLNEGWATYVTGMVYERHNTPAQWMSWKTGQINSVTSAAGGSVYVNDTTNINRIFDGRLTYNKGSMLLHMLRWVVGDSAFFAGTKNYLNDPQLKHSYALTQDFQQHLEQASGISLTEFFNDWYYGQGYPRYQVQWQQTWGSADVIVTLGQTQSNSSVSFFEMPVPIKFSNGTQDTTVVFNHTSSGQVFTFNPGFWVTSVTLDPEKWLVQRNSTVVSGRPGQLPEAALNLYPNPAHEEVNVVFAQPLTAPVQVTVLDALGKEVMRYTLTPIGGANSFILNVAKLPAGLYQLKLQTDTWITTRKLIRN